MPIIRFIDNSGQTHMGSECSDGTANILSGNIESGFHVSPTNAPIAKYLAPVVPPNIFAIGMNYKDHVGETGATISKYPVVFMKSSSSLNNPNDPIIPPACSLKGPETDYEGELAVVIKKTTKNIPVSQAHNCVLGYTCANDVSARRWQKHAGEGQYVRGKSFDTFCPLGPRILTPQEIGDPQNLTITTKVNGQIMQHSNTSQMMHSIAEIISYLSQDTTLLPGTVILTGTPHGVGFVRKPMVFLTPGDEVSVEIEKIGCLTNPVAAPDSA